MYNNRCDTLVAITTRLFIWGDPRYTDPQPVSLTCTLYVEMYIIDINQISSDPSSDIITNDIIWQRTAQDRLTWRWHTEVFAQPQDTSAAH